MNATGVKIEKGVPIPPVARAERKRKYPLGDIEVGDSFFRPNIKASSMHACIVRFNKANTGEPREFLLRQVVEDYEGNPESPEPVPGVRVWRTK